MKIIRQWLESHEIQNKKCVWSTDDKEFYMTDCGSNFSFYTKADNQFLFCPFCGREIRIFVEKDSL